MSKCISSHGEYSEHEVATDFTCELCGVFDERAALDRIKELEAERDECERQRLLMSSLAGETLAELLACRSRLARVTDDSMAERFERCVRERYSAALSGPSIAAIGRDALMVVRAVAADEQEATDAT